MSHSQYLDLLSSLNNYALAIMAANPGNLAPSTPRWKAVLQVAYMEAYLRRDSIKVSLLASDGGAL
jgi:hypothetical protein